MTEKTQRAEWMNAFFPPMSKDKDQEAYGALFALGRVALMQATTLQRAALEFYRQSAESETAERSVRSNQEELLRRLMESLDPVFAIEQAGRQQFLKSQAALFDLCEDALRGFARYGEEQSKSKPT